MRWESRHGWSGHGRTLARSEVPLAPESESVSDPLQRLVELRDYLAAQLGEGPVPSGHHGTGPCPRSGPGWRKVRE